MFGSSFYFGLTRKYIIYFGTLFNDIIITKEDANGNVIESLKVPLSYAAKDKMLARVMEDPNLNRETALSVPRMSFIMNRYMYDGARKLPHTHRIARKDDDNPNKFKYQYTPVPVNIPFTLYIYVKNYEDGAKIVEQILPHFVPEWNATVHLIPEMNITADIPIILQEATLDDPFEGSLTTRRPIIWTLDFIMKGFLYGPIRKSPIIKFANTRFYFGNGYSNTANTEYANDASEIVSTLTATPGMLANGSPTTNASLSISPLLIEVDDDWNYAIQQSGLVIVQD